MCHILADEDEAVIIASAIVGVNSPEDIVDTPNSSMAEFSGVVIPKVSGFAFTKASTEVFSSAHHWRIVEESCTEVVVTERGV